MGETLDVREYRQPPEPLPSDAVVDAVFPASAPESVGEILYAFLMLPQRASGCGRPGCRPPRRQPICPAVAVDRRPTDRSQPTAAPCGGVLDRAGLGVVGCDDDRSPIRRSPGPGNQRDTARRVGRLNVADVQLETERTLEDGDRLAHNPEVAGSNPVPLPAEMAPWNFPGGRFHARWERFWDIAARTDLPRIRWEQARGERRCRDTQVGCPTRRMLVQCRRLPLAERAREREQQS